MKFKDICKIGGAILLPLMIWTAAIVDTGIAATYSNLMKNDSTYVDTLVPPLDSAAVYDSLAAKASVAQFEADSSAMDDSLAAKASLAQFLADSAETMDSIALKLAIDRWLADSANVWDSLAVHRQDINDLDPLGVLPVLDTARVALDSAQQAADSANLALLQIDSLKYYYGEAADTTSPGKFYYYNQADSLWHRAGTSSSITALGVAVDSVPLGEICRYQYTGLFSDADYDNIIHPGKKVVNDSVTAGLVAVVDSNRTNTKKMQGYGVARDSITIMLNIDSWVWVWE
jgi:hypothetical protein